MKDFRVIKTNLLRLIGNNKARNTLPVRSNESYEHLQKKLEVGYYLVSQGYDIVYEARFKTGGRADIYILDLNVAIEVLVSEKDESIINKESVYPCNIIKVYLDTEVKELTL